MRQVRITSQNIDHPQEDDCYLAPDDPVHVFKQAMMLGGLNPAPPEEVEHIKLSKVPQYKNSILRKGENMATPKK